MLIIFCHTEHGHKTTILLISILDAYVFIDQNNIDLAIFLHLICYNVEWTNIKY